MITNRAQNKAPKSKARLAAPKSKPKVASRNAPKSKVISKKPAKPVAKKAVIKPKPAKPVAAKSTRKPAPRAKLLSIVKPGKPTAATPKSMPPMSKSKTPDSKKSLAQPTNKKDTASAWNGNASANKAASKTPIKSAVSSSKSPDIKAVNRIGANGTTKPPKATLPKKPKVVEPPVSSTSPKIVRKIRELQTERELRKDLGREVIVGKMAPNQPRDIVNNPTRDRLALIVRDPYWLHASWEITRRSVDRARAAMAEHWHTVRAVLRLLKIDSHGTTSNAETVFRDIEIHGGVRNWYIDVPDPPSTFRAQIGYLAGNGRFHELAASNVISTAAPGSTDSISEHWADIDANAEHIYAMSGGYNEECDTKDLRQMFEDRLERPMGAPALTQFGSGADVGFRRVRKFHFNVDAEMIVYGSTRQDAYVTLSGEPVKVEADGTFSIRVPMPDRRQVLPVIASTRDGVDEQTIVIMVERNTKVLEPLSKENEE